jgi:hypothetical protein
MQMAEVRVYQHQELPSVWGDGVIFRFLPQGTIPEDSGIRVYAVRSFVYIGEAKI